jgi:hypothetical protein
VGGSPVREWYAQIFQSAEIIAGKPYTLRFRARADSKHFLTVGSEAEGNAPYVNLGLLERVLLTPRWQTFQFTFMALSGATGKTRIPVFSAGHRGGAVFVADVALVPGELPLPESLQRLKQERERAVQTGANLITDANDADA